MKPEFVEDYSAYVAAAHARHHRLAMLLCADATEADDVVQNVLIRLYRHWPRVVSQGQPDAYVRTAIQREANSWRRRAFRRYEDRTDQLPESVTDEHVVADLVARRVDLSVLLPRLSPRQRLAIVTRYYEDQSIEDVAVVLGCSPATAKRVIRGALELLRQLAPEGGET